MVARHLHGLRDFNCPINLYKLSNEYFSNRTAVKTTIKREKNNKELPARILL